MNRGDTRSLVVGRWVIPAGSLLLATGLTFWLPNSPLRQVPLTLYLAAFVVSMWRGGRMVGMGVAVCGAVIANVEAGYSSSLILRSLVLVGIAAVISWILAEREREGRSLKQSEVRYAAIVNTALDCVVGMDHAGRVTEWNPAAEGVFGFSRAEVMGREMAELIIPPGMREKHRAGLRKYLETGTGPVIGKRLELTAVNKSGAEFPVELTIIRMPGGGDVRFTGYLRDISERKVAEGERAELLTKEQAAREEAERASRVKDEFLATLSHELRTPLNAILGWSQILNEKGRNEEDVEEGIAVIERNARAQTRIIEDLLEMSRIVSGKIRLDVRQLELLDAVQAAVDTVRPAAETKGVRLEVTEDGSAHPVRGDANRLQQVFWNLLSNAVKFTPAGGRVEVRVEQAGPRVEVSVMDTGEGISPEFMPFVFDRFRQADSSTSRKHGGLGLGLSIVKQLVELHGGSVSAKSLGAGQGATFMVALPMTSAVGVKVAEGVRAQDSVDIAGVRVLVVDDEVDARGLVRKLLEDRRAVVTVAGSAAEGLAAMQSGTFDVVVSDVGMPGDDGYWFIQRVREMGAEAGGAVPAIALTAYARVEDRVRAMRGGFQMHLCKPVESADLAAAVGALAGKGGRG